MESEKTKSPPEKSHPQDLTISRGVCDLSVVEIESFQVLQTLKVFQRGVGDLRSAERESLQIGETLEVFEVRIGKVEFREVNLCHMNKKVITDQIAQPFGAGRFSSDAPSQFGYCGYRSLLGTVRADIRRPQ